jgi:hypothetical protein
MATTDVRLDGEANNTNGGQTVGPLLYDAARSKVHACWAPAGVAGNAHNRKIMFCSVDIATKTPGTVYNVEPAQTANDLEALSAALLSSGTLLTAYGLFGVRVKESTDGGVTWPTSGDIDGTWGSSTRGCAGLIVDADAATICQLITYEGGGGGSARNTYMRQRTGAGTWGTQVKIHDNALGYFVWDTVNHSAARIGHIFDANHAVLVGDYSNAGANVDQVRALITTDGWATSSTVLIYDYTGSSVPRCPIVRVGSDGTIYVMWIEGGDPVFAHSEDRGATWTVVGSPAALAAVPWDVTYDRWLALDSTDALYAGAWDNTDGGNLVHHSWRGLAALTGWVDDPSEHLTHDGTGGMADALIVGDDLWRLYTWNDTGPVSKVYMLIEGDVVPAAVTPPDPGETQLVPTILAKITLTDTCGAGAKTLYFGMPAFTDPTGQPWDPLIAGLGQAHAGGTPWTNRWNPGDCDLRLKNERVAGQGVSETLLDLFAQYEWTDAPILIQYAFEGIAFVDGEFPILDGRVSKWKDMDSLGVTLYCTHNRDWGRAVIPPGTIELNAYPNAPKDTVGQRKQIAYGDWKTRREKDTSLDVASVYSGITRAPMPLLPISSQTAAGDDYPTLLVSDKEVADDTRGIYIYENAVDQYAQIYTEPTESNPAGGPDTILFDQQQFIVPILPVAAYGTTTIGSIKELLREDKPIDLSGYSSLDYTGGNIEIQMTFGDSRPDGEFVSLELWIFYAKNAWSGTLGRWGIIQRVGFASLTSYTAFGAGASTTFPSNTPIQVAGMTVDPTVVGKWDDFNTAIIHIQTRDTGQKVDVHRIMPVVRYIPSGRILRPGRAGAPIFNVRTGQVVGRHPGVSEIRAIDAKTFAFPVGVPDQNHDSGAPDGAYAGSPGALIEHPVDLVHWAKCELGGVTEAEIATGSDLGSFTAAKTALSGYKIFGAIDREQRLEDWVAEIARQILCWFPRKTGALNSPFCAIPWDPGTAANYRTEADPTIFTRGMIEKGSLKIGRTDVEDVANVIRVNFDYDGIAGTYAEQVFVTDTDSRGWTGSAFAQDQATTTPNDRQTQAGASIESFGRIEFVHNCPNIKDPATATDIRDRLFDWKVQPHVLTEFVTYVNAQDIERGHVLQLGADWDAPATDGGAPRPFPKPCSDGSWAGKNLMVYEKTRAAGLPNRYLIRAVEI